ncbi:RNA-binding protein [Candidatus Woesearchaeota archaeon CG10_big_fil_rev_8_21_14_0_10_37_12]|nr:MAG: RNA-binding protein [Candidatus Woesearchaeota archaeon CG10_big_fil_rev_8_21_14_0_10_37_12]
MKEELKVNDKDIVVPGETIATGMSFLPGPGTYRYESNIVAQKLGMVSVDGKVIKLITLSGKYDPKVKDRVIGRVVDVLMTGWRFDINCPYSAVLNMKDAVSEFIPRGADLTQYFNISDYAIGMITNVTSQKLVDIATKGPGLRKLRGGRIISVSPKKVPRIIGKEGSMVTLIKEKTGCDIVVGQNGLVWISGEPHQEVVAVNTIKTIEQQAHLSGLTERVSEMLANGGSQ